MKLKTIEMSNVLCYEKAEVELSDSLTILTGNSDAGKSVVVRAALQACRNEPSGVSLLRHGVKRGVNSEVVITGENDGDEFSIKRTRGRSTNEYEVNGEVLRAIGTGSPAEVDNLLNLSPNAIQTQWEGHFLLSATDGAIARTIGSAIGLSDIDKMFGYIRRIKSENDAKVRVAENTEAQESQALAKYDGIAEVGEVVAELAKLDSKVQDMNNIILAAGSAKAILASMPDVSAITAELKEVAGYVGAIAELAIEIAVCEASAEKATTMRAVLASGNPLAVVRMLGALKDELSAISNFYDAISGQINRIDDANNYREELLRHSNVEPQLQEVKANYKLAWDTDGVASMCVIKLESLNKHRRALLVYADHTVGLNDVSTAMDSCEALSQEWHNTVTAINKLRDLQCKLTSLKNEHSTANRELMQVKSAMMKFKMDNTECPECGALQEHWRSSTQVKCG